MAPVMLKIELYNHDNNGDPAVSFATDAEIEIAEKSTHEQCQINDRRRQSEGFCHCCACRSASELRVRHIVTIEQHGVAKFGLASFSYVSVRHLEPDPPRTIRSTQVKGNMRRLESLMTLAPDGDGTKLVYHLEMVPGALAATVMSKEFLEHELREQFSAIIEEMARRSR